MRHTVSGQTTSYTWDAAAELPVVLQDGTNTYVYGLDLISATDNSGVQTYFLYDGLGSTTDLADGSANVVATYRYDAFGAIRSQTGSSPNQWLFTGEQRDSDSSMYYLRARYYDPAIGRFLSQDPAHAGHPYGYGANNPTRYVDPYGLDICDILPGKAEEKCREAGDQISNTAENIYEMGDDIATAPLDALRDPTINKAIVLTLDVVALELTASAALTTDAATLTGCGLGLLAGAFWVGCAAGYGAGRAMTADLMVAGNVASSLSAGVSCVGEEASLPDCVVGGALALVSWQRWVDPNLGMFFDAAVLCRDAGWCEK